MQLIILRNLSRRQRRLHLGSFACAVAALGLAALVAGAAYGGYRLAAVPVDPRPDLYAAAWQKEVIEQRDIVRTAVARAEADIDALALRVGELQARLVRLDALGGRLVGMAELDDEEFGFGEVPARGGPAPARAPAETYDIPDFVSELAAVAQWLEDRGPKLVAIEGVLMNRSLDASLSPSGRPVLTGWLSSRFGWRSDPISGKRTFHEGMDFAGKRGSDVVAVAAGLVRWSGKRSGYGKVVEINHGKGFITRYAHNAKNVVLAGQTIRKGQKVAEMGSTGQSTGVHVHFEVLKDGKPIDPLDFVRAAR